MNRKLTKTLLLLVCLSTQGLAVNDNQTSFDFSKLKPKELAYESSDHQLDWCYLKESGQIDYRSKTRQDLDRMFSCKMITRAVKVTLSDKNQSMLRLIHQKN